MKITLGFSPCPNDTFMFHALVNGLLDTGGLEFEPFIADVEALNKEAFAARLDVTKLSYHALGHLLDRYELLDAGSALGNNCGPLLIAKRPLHAEEIHSARIAIPGRLTTANFLLSLAFPDHTNRIEMLFSEIEDAVLSGSVDAGLIIHENRFTYEQKGLVKIMDLGEYWERQTELPIPLGAIAVKRSLPHHVKLKIEQLLRASVVKARENPAATTPYVKKYAQEMDPEVMHKHINLYVNDFSISLGERGRKAVSRLFEMAAERKIIPPYTEIFLIN